MNWLNRLNILGIVAIASSAIASSASAQFVIFVSGNDPATLQRVRAVSPSAFATKINDQPIVQAGLFNSEASANQMAIALQQSGLTPQKYFRTSGGKESNVQVPFTDNAVVSNPAASQVSTPQQVVIQPSQQAAIATDQQFFAAPQSTVTYSAPQQIVTNTVVPQIQTQQVLVPRWQQVLVPETRQVITQTIVPQTQIVQTGFVQTAAQPMVVQGSGTYVQPQTSFIPTTGTTTISSAPVNYDSFASSSTSTLGGGFSTVQSQPVTTLSSDPSFVQTGMQTGQTQTSRYVAVVPANANSPSSQFLLSRVRQYIPTAFFSNSGRGSYIHAGAYQNRDSAEAVSRYLRSQGVDSRVIYF